jgi:prepilin-type N-terminal cleavage/methylation domain-containing protein
MSLKSLRLHRGFSLLEALVATAILALSIPALIAVLTGSADREQRAAAGLARDILAEQLLVSTTARFAGHHGRSGGTAGGLGWSIETSSRDGVSKESRYKPVHVAVEVTDATGAATRLETLILYAGHAP